jgi:hypothetical protein
MNITPVQRANLSAMLYDLTILRRSSVSHLEVVDAVIDWIEEL